MCAGAAQEKDENTIAKAYFRWSAEGWNATTKEGDDWPSSGELGYLKSSDDDDTLWYYTASPDFLGEMFKICAHAGAREYDSLDARAVRRASWVARWPTAVVLFGWRPAASLRLAAAHLATNLFLW